MSNCEIITQNSLISEVILEPKYEILLSLDDEDLDCELAPRIELDLYPVLPISSDEEAEFDADLLLYYNIAKL